MNYEVSEKKGETVRVGLRELGEDQFEVTIGGRTVSVDAAKGGRTVYSILENGRQFEAVVEEQGAHGFEVLVAGRLFHLEAIDERTKMLAGSAHAPLSGRQVVAAEISGKVVKLEASVGDAVDEGQGVVVLEAMKMENEILSPISGVVTEMAVEEGQTVETGATLFVVEPPPSAE